MFEESRRGLTLVIFWVVLPSLRGSGLQEDLCRSQCSSLMSCVHSDLLRAGLLAGSGAVRVQLQRADAHRAPAVHRWPLPTAAGGGSQDGSVLCPENFQRWCVWRNPQKAVWGHEVLGGHGNLGSFPGRVKSDVLHWRTLHVIPACALHKLSLPLECNSSEMCARAFLKDRAQKALSHSEIFVL